MRGVRLDVPALLLTTTDVLRGVLLGGAVVYLVMGDVDNAVRLAGTFALVLVPRLIHTPRLFDLAFCLGMIFQAFGNTFALFDDYSWYDKVVHFVLPFGVAPLLYLVLIRLDAVPDLTERAHRRHDLGIFIITMALGITVGALYEVYEYIAVYDFGADKQIDYGDTINDLVDDAAASVAGSALLIGWGRNGWGTRRRTGSERLEAAD